MPDFSRFRPHSSQGWLAWVLLAFILFFSVASDQFLTMQNLLDLAESYAVTGIFALGLFVVLVTGGIDISFAAVASVVQYLLASLSPLRLSPPWCSTCLRHSLCSSSSIMRCSALCWR